MLLQIATGLYQSSQLLGRIAVLVLLT